MAQDDLSISIDTGAGLAFTIRRKSAGEASRGAGDIVSMRYDGVEFQDSQKGSQINSGFSDLYDRQAPVSVDAQQVDADHVKVTVRAGDLIHYYMAKRGLAAIFMATHFASEPKPGLVRYIARIRRDALPDGSPPADLLGTDRIVEAHDIFGLPNGETRSKHYSNMRLKDWQFFGARGSGVAVWMVRDNNEGGSGGPFYRSLLDQGTLTDQELTYIVNYGEAQTEPFRTDVLDSYALVFTHGKEPDPLDTSWFGRMSLSGYVGPEARGRVVGTGIAGMDPTFDYTVGFAEAGAQYWTPAARANGAFTCDGMRPGTYRMTIYKNELAVASSFVRVDANQTTRIDTVPTRDDPARVVAIWRIGRWDGTPSEFLNGTRITVMHPSDRRMGSWATAPFVVGTSATATDFPAYQWKEVNSLVRVRFQLSRAPVAAMTLRIGITAAFANGRPAVQINQWTAPLQPISIQPTSRTLTVGTYRGNNHIYAIAVPASAFRAGVNELRLSVTSGELGTDFLSPGLSYDAIDLVDNMSSAR
ncbi:rhamnogalacturonan lyase B N-terminal domain-containing protein [Paraburkholderia sp. UYCP14C]|uniref:rhamnogalacturonan lyase B N-terminal domain-containing protein n=1 Tax=Paraburkholderia sp. UYCP14C TaxID=2511130 RepID=UPI00145A01ED|nr:rhamnogalacturonan lyase B N-terminal domain-containing protein [Paraburkholderia sp. UYCP14C]